MCLSCEAQSNSMLRAVSCLPLGIFGELLLYAVYSAQKWLGLESRQPTDRKDVQQETAE